MQKIRSAGHKEENWMKLVRQNSWIVKHSVSRKKVTKQKQRQLMPFHNFLGATELLNRTGIPSFLVRQEWNRTRLRYSTFSIYLPLAIWNRVWKVHWCIINVTRRWIYKLLGGVNTFVSRLVEPIFKYSLFKLLLKNVVMWFSSIISKQCNCQMFVLSKLAILSHRIEITDLLWRQIVDYTGLRLHTSSQNITLVCKWQGNNLLSTHIELLAGYNVYFIYSFLGQLRHWTKWVS